MKLKELVVLAGLAGVISGCEEPVARMEYGLSLPQKQELWEEFQETCISQTYQSMRNPDNYSLRAIVEQRGPSQVEWICRLEKGNFVAVQEIPEE